MAFPHEPAAHLLGSNGPVHAVTYSASPGTYILTGSADRTIRLYNPFPSTRVPEVRGPKGTAPPSVPQGRLIQSYEAHGYEVLSLDVSPSNEAFVSAGGDRSVFLWDVATAVTTRRFGGSAQGHTSRINCVAFAGGDGGDSLIVSGGFDTTVRLWDGRSNNSSKPIQVLTEARDAITSLAVRGPEVVAASVDGRVRSYDVRMGKCTTDIIGASATSVCLTKDGRAMLVGSLDSKLRLMDRDSGACLRAYEDPEWRNDELRVQSMLAGREKYVIVGDEMAGDDAAQRRARGLGRILVWDLLSGKSVAKIDVPWGPQGYDGRRKVVGRDGKEKLRSNVISCMAWRDDGWGDQFCVGGTSGVVTVYEAPRS
ncbi:hypothetical protein K4F52_003275 [Lecanicillium sp. MT-2017a]|nr:hypothetical protein K4F52_003275 [Lecanicillium sp. MT-2017a]